MASYRLGFKPSAAKELEGLAAKDRKRVAKRIQALAQNPRPYGSDKISGEEKYRLRQGDLRIVCGINDKDLVVLVWKIAHRRDVYRS